MKKFFTPMKAILLIWLIACFAGAANAQLKPIKFIQNGDTLITANQTWDADTIYYLKGHVFVTNNAELTIQAGTIIYGDSLNKGALIICTGSKIHAIGTPSCPIVFTSAKIPKRRARGDWGGVILLGLSATNNPGGTQYIEGLPPSPLTQFGGGASPNLHDNSGEMEYCRIEFAGVALSPNNEINGLTFGAVGDGTTIDFIQVSYSNDDSYEWFGGTVNCRHLIAFRGIDDDFDTDNGFSGKVQFGIGIRDPLVADISGSKGFESDNNATGTTDLPQTRAIFSNMTVEAGSDSATNSLFVSGAHIRRNSHLYIYNSIIMGYPEGLLIDGTTTESNVLADTMVKHNIIGNKYAPKNVVTTPDNPSVVNLLGSNADNRFYTDNTQVLLKAPYNLSKPDVRPVAGSPALTGANFFSAGLNDPFFTKTKYVGALAKSSTTNWATIWVNWQPTKTDYSQVNANCATSALVAQTTAEAQAQDKIESRGEVKVYPNPSNGSFKVDLSNFSGNVTIKVTNVNGSVIYTTQAVAAAKDILNVNLNVTAGLYYVTVTDGKYSTTTKVNIVK